MAKRAGQAGHGELTVVGGSYAWIAGESKVVTGLRRHLVNDRGVPRRSITFSGYWRRGASEEDLQGDSADWSVRDAVTPSWTGVAGSS